MKQQKCLAVFDWNGTLFDDLHALVLGANAVLKLFDLPELTVSQYQEYFDIPVVHFYKRCGLEIDVILREQERFVSHFESIYEIEAAKCTSRIGTEEILAWLNESEAECIILSNHLYESISDNLSRLGLWKYIRHISANDTRQDVVHKITKQDRLSLYMNEHGYRPENSFIIGDSLEEPQIARNLGMLGISITGGSVSEARLRKVNPDNIIPELSELRIKLLSSNLAHLL